LGVGSSASQQVVSEPLVAAAQAQALFTGDRGGREQTGAGLGEEMADRGRDNAVSELQFLIAPG
jgi:hypothetical protein